MVKEVNNRKPIQYASYAITEEYFDDFKEAKKLSKKDWRFSKEDLPKELGNKSKMSFVIRYMIRKYVKLRQLEVQHDKRLALYIKEASESETNTDSHIQEDPSSN